jgi:hypothetical protein
MSVSCDDGDGANGTGEFNFGMANGAPTEQPDGLLTVYVRPRLAERLWVNNSQATQKILRVIPIGDVLADAKSSTGAILGLVDEV